MRTRSSFVILFLSILAMSAAVVVHADDQAIPETPAAETPVAAEPQATPTPVEQGTKAAAKKRHMEHADAFIAPPDWEFDGFVAGGQDQEVKGLFYLNDLVYLNVGTDQGFSVGDRISIYKRGQRVRDPQTGRFLGYEVRRAATTQVTDHIDAKNCSVRILQANEAVEVGDLVRRED